jgi:hypothetical protein
MASSIAGCGIEIVIAMRPPSKQSITRFTIMGRGSAYTSNADEIGSLDTVLIRRLAKNIAIDDGALAASVSARHNWPGTSIKFSECR